MKPILLQGAMKVEVENIKNALENVRELDVDGYKFYEGTYKNYPVILSITKVGSINASIATLLGIKKFNPKYIINQGVAGGEIKDIHKKDLVIGLECKNTCSHQSNRLEEGKGSNPLDWKMISFFSEDNPEEIDRPYKSDEYLIKVAEEVSKNYKDGNVHKGILGSSDTWDNEVDYIMYLNKTLGIISADMESIGTYTVATKYNIPVIGIRTISDNSINSEGYERTVANLVQKFVLEMLEKLIENKE